MESLNPISSNLFKRIELFLLFVPLTFLIIPNFFNFFPTDTQPFFWLSILFFYIAYRINNRNLFLLLSFGSVFLCYFLFRYFFFGNENFVKVVSFLSFPILLFLSSKKLLARIGEYYIPIMLFHFFLGFLLSTFISDSLFEFLYSGREGRSFFDTRSNAFVFPEASYAAKNFFGFGVALFLLDREYFSKVIVTLALLCFLTLSVTGFILSLTLAAKFLKPKILIALVGFLVLAILVADAFGLANNRVFNILLNGNYLNFILNDNSFNTRIFSLQKDLSMLLEYSLFGTKIESSATFWTYASLGIIGFIVIMLLITNLILLLLRLEIILFISTCFYLYADSFSYPAFIFMFLMITKTNAAWIGNRLQNNA